MFSKIFTDVSGSELLGVLSVLSFISIFVFRSILSLSLNKQHVEKMSHLPLRDK